MFVGCRRARGGVQIFKREFHIHIHLDYARIEFLSCIKIKNKNLLIKSAQLVNFMDQQCF